MTDRMTKAQRSRCVAAIRGKNTRPEMVVRRFLFAHGLRYRIHVSSLPGTPDMVFPKYRTVIFINGCFWHGHQGCKHSHLPQTNYEFWSNKIMRNITRDAEVVQQLQSMGYTVITVWECQLQPRRQRATLYMLLRHFLGEDEAFVPTCYEEDDEGLMAAEPEVDYEALK